MYDFDLPQSLIAQTPAKPRDHARLLVYRLKDGWITDGNFFDLDKYLNPKSTLAVNNSRVENCRWLFEDGKTEVFVLEKNDPHTIRALVRPGKKFRPGSNYEPVDWLSLETLSVDDDGIRTIRLNVSHDDSRLKQFEHIPLPPYIEQNDSLASEYQTVYAKPLGSLAAPTAGLHFTPELLEQISRSHKTAEITLHVGLGTFAKLTEENLESGHLHGEHYSISAGAADVLNGSSHITAVGTTTVRTLESAMDRDPEFIKTLAETDIFIRPGYEFAAVDSIITNFHLPGTSLLMLVAAFIADKRGLDEKEAAAELMRIYQYAIKEKYRFYSFGDAMLLV